MMPFSTQPGLYSINGADYWVLVPGVNVYFQPSRSSFQVGFKTGYAPIIQEVSFLGSTTTGILLRGFCSQQPRWSAGWWSLYHNPQNNHITVWHQLIDAVQQHGLFFFGGRCFRLFVNAYYLPDGQQSHGPSGWSDVGLLSQYLPCSFPFIQQVE